MNYFIISGTSKGFGRALVTKLLESENNFVFGISRSKHQVDSVKYKHIQFDLAKVDALNELESQIFPYITQPASVFLINNAGTVHPMGSVENSSHSDVIDHFNLNAISPILLASIFIRNTSKFQIKKGILNISSGAAITPYFGWSCYCSSKSALEMFTKCLNIEKGDAYIISTYDPGVIDTDMQKFIRNLDADQFKDVEKFKLYKSQGKLQSPEAAASKFVETFLV